MKNNKLLFNLVVILGLMFSPLFFGCKANVTITLNTPETVAYQINEETGKELLVVPYNKYASSYVFGISLSNYDGTNIDEFLRYEVPAKYTVEIDGSEVEVAHNFLDVTNIFKNAKTYYFYAQYKGSGNYKDSEISKVNSVSITQKLESPYLSLTNGVLSWSKIANTDRYSIYSEINGKSQSVDTTSETTYDVSNYINQKVADGLDSEIEFFVYANTTQNYIRSADSNHVTYSAHLYLSSPTNLSITKSGQNRYLRWRVSQNAKTYTVKVNNLEELIADKTNLTIQGNFAMIDVSAMYEKYGLGEYEFCVKANANGKFVESSYSSVVSDTYTQQLATPENVRLIETNGQILITWDAVENASTYILQFSDTLNNYALKQYIPNDSNGVPSDITTNSILLSYVELGVSSINELRSSNFVVKVAAQGYHYYTTSNYSTEKAVLLQSQLLLSPVISNDDTSNTISWNDVVGAVKYGIQIIYDGLCKTAKTEYTYFDYSDFINSAGEYSISCYAIASNAAYNSTLSNQVTKIVTVSLSTPEINKITVDDAYFVIDFTADSKAESHTLYINDNMIEENFTAQNPKVLITTAKQYAENEMIYFQLVSNAIGYWAQSDLSDSFGLSIKLVSPSISLSGNRLSWQTVDNATSYALVLDDDYFDLASTQTYVNLTEYVDINTARQVAVIATNAYLVNSELSSQIIYNRSSRNIDGYTNKYFYYGKTYDYYITSSDELYDLIEYTFVNFIPTVSGYIDFDSSSTITSKITAALNNISATKGLAPVVTKNAHRSTGEFAVSMNYYTKIETPFAGSQTLEEYSGSMVSFGNGTRDSTHVFKSDHYIVSQDVYSTDGLLSAIEHRAVPNFVETDSLAEQIYNKAKSILIEIIDDDMTDLQKALAIHDYIASNVTYDTYGLNHVSISNSLGYFHYIESALNYGLGVCDAYSKTFSLLCNMEGIECMVVDGLSDRSNSSSGHAWNKIYLDHDGDGTSDWFVVDCTWDDTLASSGDFEYLMHTYFLIPESYLSTRAEEETKNYPATTTTTDGFYSICSFNGVPLIIDSLSKVNQLKSYMASHPTAKIEYLVSQTYKNSVYKYYAVGFKYAPNENYVVAYTN